MGTLFYFIFLYTCFFFPLFFISWRLITLQYCSGFCHTLTWVGHGFTCVPYPEPPSHFPPHPIPLGHPSAPALSTCLMHPTWTGDVSHLIIYMLVHTVLEKAEEPGIKLPTYTGSQKKQGKFRKTSTSASLTMLKPLAVLITTNCGKFSKKWE